MPAVIAPDSSHRGFLQAGTGRTFAWDDLLGWDEGNWTEDPLAGQSLDDFMQQVVGAVTAIPGNLVRPRWQEEPTDIPNRGTDWAAIGVVRSTPIGYPYAVEIAQGNGFSRQVDTEEFDVLCSFYGPNADLNAIRLRSGLMVDQNREAFQLLNMGLIQTTGRTRVPELVKDIYLMRVDITFSMRRQIQMFYPVLYLLSAPATVITDVGYQTPGISAPASEVIETEDGAELVTS
jgi:hypothetical protein